MLCLCILYFVFLHRPSIGWQADRGTGGWQRKISQYTLLEYTLQYTLLHTLITAQHSSVQLSIEDTTARNQSNHQSIDDIYINYKAAPNTDQPLWDLIINKLTTHLWKMRLCWNTQKKGGNLGMSNFQPLFDIISMKGLPSQSEGAFLLLQYFFTVWGPFRSCPYIW